MTRPHYIPFGTDCLPAEILKRSEARQMSLPFDWLFTTPSIIKDSLDTDFIEWFDESKMYITYTKTDPDLPRTSHSKYVLPSSTFGIAGLAMFFHHNMLDRDVQESFKRRISRFKEIISSDDSIVFVTAMSKKEISDYEFDTRFYRGGKTKFLSIQWTESQTESFAIEHNDQITTLTCSSQDKWSDYIVNIAYETLLSISDV